MFSTVLRKALNALSGLLLIGFLVTHLAGNLLLFQGAEVYNGYGESLKGMGYGLLLPFLELALAALFLYHILSALLIAERWKRPSRLKVPMMLSGTILAAFLVWHLYTLRWTVTTDLHRQTLSHLQNTWELFFYLSASAALGWHLQLGVTSAMRSLGYFSPGQPRVAGLFSGIFAGGFSVIVLGAYLYL